MGNICCGGQEEGTKPSTSFLPVSTGVERSPSTPDAADWSSSAPRDDGEAVVRSAALAQGILQSAGRAMVSIHTRRTDRHYYSDQGFAAALAQHLSERMPDMTAPPRTLPLYRPHSGKKEEVPRRRNLEAVLDQVSDAILERAVPPPERLWAPVPPMMENLL
jgi:hypothetical protein